VTASQFDWVKGHGTENDFVLLPDPDGSVHGALDSPADRAFVATLCHRRRGLGADGVIRVVRAADLAGTYGVEPAKQAVADGAEWFMDYRNADGSDSEMCGNGIRVLARWLLDEGWLHGAGPWQLGTRGGTRDMVAEPGGRFASDLGPVTRLPDSEVVVAGHRWPALGVDVGNPHAVVAVDDLADVGPLTEPPTYDPALYPDGANVEFVTPAGERQVAMRVYERGSGETRSCGTGAVAAAVLAEQVAGVPGRPSTYQVDVPGGRLDVTLRADGHGVLIGPAEIIACGSMTWEARS
jgi:diaminopimelate epimerase